MPQVLVLLFAKSVYVILPVYFCNVTQTFHLLRVGECSLNSHVGPKDFFRLLFFQVTFLKACVILRTHFFPTQFANISALFESALLLQYVHDINNQRLSTAKAKDINTHYCITNSTLASSCYGSAA